jgi:tetratricopeptide (TPR) repeat protein
MFLDVSSSANHGGRHFLSNCGERSLSTQKPDMSDTARTRTPLPRARLLDLAPRYHRSASSGSGKRHPSHATSLSQLIPIRLTEMHLATVHTGTFLLCRTLLPPTAPCDIVTVAEDLNRDTVLLSLSNFYDPFTPDPSSWLPSGQILAIKEPYLVADASLAGELLDCDSPSDVVFIHPWDSDVLGGTAWFAAVLPSYDDAKAIGNAHFARKEYQASLRMYDLALSLHPNDAVIHLNRSAALLNLDRNFEAFQSAAAAQASVSADLNREKVHFRLATAAYRLRDWGSAATHFAALCALAPDSAEYRDWLQRARARQAESATGQFDIRALSRAVVDAMRRGAIAHPDAADYTGPVDVADIPGKGRGIVAARAVKRGTLLVAAKPFAWASRNRGDPRPARTVAILGELIDESILFVRKNPQRAEEVYSLWNGESRQSVPPGVIDTHRIATSCRINSFKAMLNLLDVISPGAMECLPMGFYYLPSFFNHSCVANAARFFYGDFLMVYAIEDIAKGDEITIEYLPAGDDLQRQERFIFSFGFGCGCPMCAEQARNPDIDRRIEVWRRVQVVQRRTTYSRADVRELEELLEELEETYHDEKYRVNLVMPLCAIAEGYVHFKQYEKGILAFQKALKYNLSISPFGLLRVLGFAKIIFLAVRSANDQYVMPAKSGLFDLVRVHAGVDQDTFIQVWLPALLTDPATDVIECIVPLIGLTEAQLRQTREARRQACTREARLASGA